MKSLGGVALPDQTRWGADNNDWRPVGMSARYALSGKLEIVQNARSGRPIVLTWERRIAYLPDSTLTALLALADAVGGQHTLVWESDSYTALFDHSSGPFRLSRVLPLHDAWLGELHLIQV